MITRHHILDWALDRTITGIQMGFTQNDGKPPIEYVELKTNRESLRISLPDFTDLFDVGIEGSAICRLHDEQALKAKVQAERVQIENAERTELERLTKKYA